MLGDLQTEKVLQFFLSPNFRLSVSHRATVSLRSKTPVMFGLYFVSMLEKFGLVDRMVGDAVQHIFEPGIWLDTMHLASAK
jgi:hypothetical protein